MLFEQHDAQWIPAGYPDAGNMLIFNHGLDRGYSTIDEIVLPTNADPVEIKPKPALRSYLSVCLCRPGAGKQFVDALEPDGSIVWVTVSVTVCAAGQIVQMFASRACQD